MQAILVIVPEKSFFTFCSLQDGGFWVFLELQFCYDPHVLPMLLTAPMVCAPLCYIWSRKLFFLMPTPQFSSEGANLGLAGSLHARLLIWPINTLKSFCFQQQKKENHLWNFYTSKNPIWDQADTGLVRDHLTVTCPLLSCSVIKSIRKLTQTV